MAVQKAFNVFSPEASFELGSYRRQAVQSRFDKHANQPLGLLNHACVQQLAYVLYRIVLCDDDR